MPLWYDFIIFFTFIVTLSSFITKIESVLSTLPSTMTILRLNILRYKEVLGVMIARDSFVLCGLLFLSLIIKSGLRLQDRSLMLIRESHILCF